MMIINILGFFTPILLPILRGVRDLIPDPPARKPATGWGPTAEWMEYMAMVDRHVDPHGGLTPEQKRAYK